MKILALEASTTSAKAMLYDTETGQFRTVTEAYKKDYFRTAVIEQAEEVYLQLTDVGRRVLDGQSPDMITLGDTYHSVLLCDQKMRPITPVYNWNNTEPKDLCAEIRKDKAAAYHYYETSGCMVHALYPMFKLALFYSRGMDFSDKFVMSQGSYLNWRMLGKRVISRCLTSGNGLLNVHTREYNFEHLNQFGVYEDNLCELVESDAVYPLLPEAAELLGVKSGIPVIAANPDGGLNQVGAGAMRKGMATFSVGTSGAVRLTTEKPVIPKEPSTWCYLSPKGWLSGAATNGCCNCTDWAKNRLFPPGTSYADIEKGIVDRRHTPVFLPFLFGERCPGWDDERRGGFFRVDSSHTANDLYLAVQEGVLFNLFQCYEILAEINGEPSDILLSGGILKSPAWTQMAADIFNKTMTVSDTEQESMMGAVVLAMEALGVIDDITEYRARVKKKVEPDPEAVELYRKKYAAYLEAYHAVKE